MTIISGKSILAIDVTLNDLINAIQENAYTDILHKPFGTSTLSDIVVDGNEIKAKVTEQLNGKYVTVYHTLVIDNKLANLIKAIKNLSVAYYFYTEEEDD